jgi:ADP-dependent NAD(P)H-hydrate dehydratase
MTAIEITPQFLRQIPLPDPKEGDKKARGSVLIIAGGRDVPGAALLAGVGAMRAGAGRLQLGISSRHSSALAMAVPEALVRGLSETAAGGVDPAEIEQLSPLLGEADAVLVGPGMQDEDAITNLIEGLLEASSPAATFVFDARAIKNLYRLREKLKRLEGRLVVTPHAGEMAGLTNLKRSEVEADPLSVARKAAADLNATIVLKGARTFVASSMESEQCFCREGNVGLATSGSGDVLAGVITGLLARGASPFVATCWAVYLHARSGDSLSRRVGPLGFLAREILDEVPRLMGELS